MRADGDDLGLVARVQLKSPMPPVDALLVAERVDELGGDAPLATAGELPDHLLGVLIASGLGAVVREPPAEDAVTLPASCDPLLGLSSGGGTDRLPVPFVLETIHLVDLAPETIAVSGGDGPG